MYIFTQGYMYIIYDINRNLLYCLRNFCVNIFLRLDRFLRFFMAGDTGRKTKEDP